MAPPANYRVPAPQKWAVQQLCRSRIHSRYPYLLFQALQPSGTDATFIRTDNARALGGRRLEGSKTHNMPRGPMNLQQSSVRQLWDGEPPETDGSPPTMAILLTVNWLDHAAKRAEV
ncbi:hypothetical protein BDP55DRAFT_671771 [Colletotrichum godetiae]|uniref:Uncharacterized protein n=1 Tax=Colletotrichum godetiae TaxID=1209918 RepID=A0AAJ0AI45_9PEZI|nr:uncharacterized protein BDP55DRAFT_671771 [Colletotrichum godetiae]KAK1672782.1 hypothetical protein BDP55DRAFT_671771 [Colletotrichum godetiae]